MKINPEDIKVGLQLLAWDVEDRKYYKTEIYKIEGNIIYLKDVDEYSTCDVAIVNIFVASLLPCDADAFATSSYGM